MEYCFVLDDEESCILKEEEVVYVINLLEENLSYVDDFVFLSCESFYINKICRWCIVFISI